jgi:hypothetical protein
LARVDFLFAEDAVPFDPNTNWGDGNTIPGYVVKKGSGSRADVKAMAIYSDGTWTVEFQRSLITHNLDDHQFE